MYPILFRLDGLTVYAYGFFLILGTVIAGILAILKVRKEGLPISFERAADLFFYTVLAAIVGSRILFVLINFDLFRENPFRIMNIWEGGLVFYGGFLLAVGVAIGYMRWHRLPILKLLDLISPLIGLGLFFGRIGCFLAGCCYGKETSLPWGVTFTNPDSLARLNVPLHPTQLYDALNGLFIKYARKPQAFKPGDEWHPFEAEPGGTWRNGANWDMIWLWLDTRLGPIRNIVCSTTWCGYRNIVGEYCEAKWSSA